MKMITVLSFVLLMGLTVPMAGQMSGDLFSPADVFEIERAVDPRISPDGARIVYVRAGFDIMTDGPRSSLWIVNTDGTGHRALVSREGGVSQPRFSPDGGRLAYTARVEDRTQIFVRWMDTGQEAVLTNLTEGAGGLTWSPDGNWIAFSMFVANPSPSVTASMPSRPTGADWGPEFRVIDELNYRGDGQGYLREGSNHLFVIPADGGTPRQLTGGPYDHGGTLSWMPDGQSIVFSANRHENVKDEPANSDVYAVKVSDGSITQITDRFGPDGSPQVSPDGRLIAYTGFDDRFQGYQVSKLYVMNVDGSEARVITDNLDRDVQGARWSADGRRVFFQYDDLGNTKIASVTLNGNVTDLATNVGGLSFGRPYGGGQFTVAANGTLTFTHGTPQHPAELAVQRSGRDAVLVTSLNEDLLGHKQLGSVEEIWFNSSFDDRPVQGWIVKPPNFDPSEKYPLILEIHGGPFANYGTRFAAELQLMASMGYVVLYTNPRGSTSYGEEFGNLIHHAYPGNDYDDLMSGVDAVIAQGYIDESNLFVTGGSGGGVLSAWIIGKTNRFRAAVVQKPVINWYSFVLNADGPAFFYKYWFPGPPWENAEHYMARSPISLVGNVTTPTMLISGEVDYRTPISEAEQYYGALQIRGIESAMVRVPDASHGIANRPSNLIAKIQYIMAWFEKYRLEAEPTTD